MVQETKPKFKVGDKIINGKDKLTISQIHSDKYIVVDNLGECGTLYFNAQDYWKLMKEEVELIDNLCKWVDEYILPDGYQFKDENGNVINATKIILEKKKKEYPKTYEECSLINGDEGRISLSIIGKFTQLINARNAYWKIAGDEMGLGKPWEPAIQDTIWGITRSKDEIEKYSCHYGKTNPLEFPTEEMRDAFYDNFKELINECKELL